MHCWEHRPWIFPLEFRELVCNSPFMKQAMFTTHCLIHHHTLAVETLSLILAMFTPRLLKLLRRIQGNVTNSTV